eukprot:CAMPEP_0183363310 /NCGR_PEP_ID=MMETSP0164_2-20130417/74567_1 /TAXON_ID=221442 /ORGANISM="Coccolithus pelagicus ssp braarudi, Strain PLY182g" /LENGTH=78 /DNA_ID=CAMNT_0025538385 /DNA_START=14 /DNA_END=247 /DNA_ORIENTATION=-
MQLPGSRRVSDLASIISTRHGDSITGLVLYKEEIHPRNQLNDPQRSLEDLLPLRETGRAEEEELVIFYDFNPHDSDCA